ncbi:uncharacterized protein LOC132611737 [Lycium barbarum]|uniref:uncharacterized protein LOC132611737 n=1 Tax=Lycium barbarum TaxID=112863 RepID=UPI00293E4786|nr:uncharacterized protein LOC132611737 [Lycium barbarum]
MRQLVEIWNVKHNEEAKNTFTDLTEKYQENIKDYRILARRMTLRASTEFLHTVTDGAKRFRVCLQTRTCSCGRFQLDEIPCTHAMAVIVHRHQHEEDYTSTYYNNKNFRDAYAIPIEPFPCEST